MTICYKCEIWMNDTKKPETLAYMFCNKHGEKITGFQRYDVFECPNCYSKAFGSPGKEYTFDDIKDYNPQYRDAGDVPVDKTIIENVKYHLNFEE